MVKADISRDYYADLVVTSTASDEEIKKAFRSLAKLYHPDRNPGKEVDVVPRFQAVQAAHEVLSDPEQKRKYDLDRARLKSNGPTIPRRGPVPPTPTSFPPPPRRAPSTAPRQNPFAGNANTARTRQAPPPANAEKYGPYARAGAQQWEKTKEEAQSKADAFRGFQQMRPGQSPTGERFAPPPPPPPTRQSGYPTTPRPTSYVPKSAGPTPSTEPQARRSLDEFNKAGRFSAGAESSAGFPGLSRTQSTRKKQGFTPTTPGGDELPAPRSSAYAATYARGERLQPSTAQSYFSEASTQPTSQTTPQRPSASPLRHSRSIPGSEDDRHLRKPCLERVSSRYSGIGGERTDVTSAGLGRSSSVRNSPIDSKFNEHERNGLHHPYPHNDQPRPRSSSPKTRPPPVRIDSSSSGSETSTDEDSTQKWAARPKATPRQTRPPPVSADLAGKISSNGSASLDQFPGTAYVKPPTPREAENARYQYRPVPSPRTRTVSQAAFNYVPGYSEQRPTAQHPVQGAGNGHAGPAAPDNGPNISPSGTDTTKPRAQSYFHSASQEDVSKKFSTSEWENKFTSVEDIFRPNPSEPQLKRSPVRPQRSRAKSHSKTRSSPIRESPNDLSTGINGFPGEVNAASEAFVPGRFSAEEWAEKLKFQATAGPHEDDQTKNSKYEFKVPAPKLPQPSAKSGSPVVENEPSDASANETGGARMKVNDDIDPMDLDDSFPSSVPSTPSEVQAAAAALQPTPQGTEKAVESDRPGMPSLNAAALDVGLNELSNVAPFKPSDTGLDDLKDFHTTLPFESKASPARPSQVMSNGIAFSSLKALNLPKPPKDVIAPLENVSQEAWIRYTGEMSGYMHDWQIFNKKMLDHFAARQAQLDMTLMSNWMSALGDGPSGEEISRKIHEDQTVSATPKAKAGYAAYRQWMEEDMRVREWWNVACERHQQAVIELGRVRERAKLLAAV